MKRRPILLLAFLLAPALACQVLIGIGDHDFTGPEEVFEAGPDAADAAPPDLCPHAGPPGPPTEGEGKGPRLAFVLRTVSVKGATDGGTPAGVDLDNACTCDPRDPRSDAGPTCLAPTPISQCDGDGGIDNAVAGLLDNFQKFLSAVAQPSDIDQTLNRDFECGRQSLLFTVDEYNGRANDSQILLRASVTYGIRQPHASGSERTDLDSCPGLDGGAQPEGGSYPARFDESDRWSVGSGGVGGDGNLRGPIFAGWVKDFQIVVDGRSGGKSDVLPILLFGTSPMFVTAPVFSGKLVPLDEAGRDIPVDSSGKILSADGTAKRFRITNGLLAGRAPASDLLAGLGTVSVNAADGSGQVLLCAVPLFAGFKTTVCRAADSARVPLGDNRGQPCEALSIGVQFEASPASIGGVHDPSDPDTSVCGATWPPTCEAN